MTGVNLHMHTHNYQANWERETEDADAVLQLLGFDPERSRDEGGRIRLDLVRDSLKTRDEALASTSTQPASASLEMRPMKGEDGTEGWYIDGPGFYCDIERKPGEGYEVFIRSKKDGAEGFAESASPSAVEPTAQPADRIADAGKTITPALQPLTEELITALWTKSRKATGEFTTLETYRSFTRAIEAAHNIKAKD